MNWITRLLSSQIGSPEMYNACLLLGVCGLIAYTGYVVVATDVFDATTYAISFSIISGGTGGCAWLTAKGRAVETKATATATAVATGAIPPT